MEHIIWRGIPTLLNLMYPRTFIAISLFTVTLSIATGVHVKEVLFAL